MKLLIGIPCLYNSVVTNEAIAAVINKTDVLLIDNGAEHPVKEVIATYPQAKVIVNPENIYVNPGWNQIIKYFLESDYTHLVIMNSDLIMQEGWYENLETFINHYPFIPIPVINGDSSEGYTEVFSGPPGVFICLTREQVELVYPIPDYLKIWFGDNWIYEILRTKYKTVVLHNLVARHYHSQSVSQVEGISELIEEDKKNWAEKGIVERDNKIKNITI